MKVTIYYSSVAGSTKAHKETIKIRDILDAKKVEYECIDISTDTYINLI
jgi:hypothetical protein